MVRVPASVGVLGVGGVTAVCGGGPPLAPPPPRRAPQGCASAVRAPNLADRGGLSCLAPACVAVEPLLSCWVGLDGGTAGG